MVRWFASDCVRVFQVVLHGLQLFFCGFVCFALSLVMLGMFSTCVRFC